MKTMVYVLAVFVLFVACNKYEEGPDFSLQSKVQRINNRWKIQSVYENDADATANFCMAYPGYQLNIGSDNKYTLSYQVTEQDRYVERGEWKFNNDKTHVIFTAESGKETDCIITRLEKNDLRIKYTCENGAERKVDFIPKTDG